MRCRRTRNTEASEGFSLPEVTISLLLLALAAAGVARLAHLAVRATFESRLRTTAAVLAADKLEELRSLDWGYGASAGGLGPPTADLTTDLSGDVPGAGGTGLQATPADVLSRNTPPYVDFLDDQGVWLGRGTTPPSGTAFVRRWSVRPWPADPVDTLLLEVSVVPYVREVARPGGAPGRLPDEARVATLKTRKPR